MWWAHFCVVEMCRKCRPSRTALTSSTYIRWCFVENFTQCHLRWLFILMEVAIQRATVSPTCLCCMLHLALFFWQESIRTISWQTFWGSDLSLAAGGKTPEDLGAFYVTFTLVIKLRFWPWCAFPRMGKRANERGVLNRNQDESVDRSFCDGEGCLHRSLTATCEVVLKAPYTHQLHLLEGWGL